MTSSERQSKQAAQPQDFEAVKTRLEEIADTVDDESLSLDEALDLFEEAVGLGLKVSDYIEEDIAVQGDAAEVVANAGEDAVAEVALAASAAAEAAPDESSPAEAAVVD